MCGVLQATDGDIFVNGKSIAHNPDAAKRELGFLPQQVPLYPEFTVDEYLRYCGSLRGLSGQDADKAVKEAKGKCGVSHFSKRLIGALSGGYRQRVGLAQAILHKPSLVVLDEPTNGLDPNQIVAVRDLICEIGEERTVLLSTHVLTEVNESCEEVRMLHAGRLVFSGATYEFRDLIPPRGIRVSMKNPPDSSVVGLIPGVLGVDPINANTFVVSTEQIAEVTDLLIAESVRSNWRLQEITALRASMEEVFAYLSGEVAAPVQSS